MNSEELSIDKFMDFDYTKLVINEGEPVYHHGYNYKTVIIKNEKTTQQWFAENLRVSDFNDGSIIGNLVNQEKCCKNKMIANCYDYDGLVTNTNIYGKLYNWYAVNDNKRICPEGWEVPTIKDWIILTSIIGSVGSKLKESGTEHWASPNLFATNDTNFSALPGGVRMSDGEFKGMHKLCVWWSATPMSPTSSANLLPENAFYIRLTSDSPCVNIFDGGKNNAFSIRLIKRK